MIKVLGGLLLAVALALALQTWRLDSSKQEAQLLETNNGELTKSVKQLAGQYSKLQQDKTDEIDSLNDRAVQREEYIGSLHGKIRKLAEIPPSNDGCLDSDMPNDLIRMLQGANHSSIRTTTSDPTSDTNR